MQSYPSLDIYFLNNDPLPDTLLSDLSSHLDDLSESINVIDSEVEALERRLAIAKERQAKLHTRKTLASSFRSNIRCLPAEIVAIVLFYALELDVAPLNFPGRKQFRAFRHVSSLWRRTAFATLNLWHSLSVDVSEPSQGVEGPTSLATRLASWFSRAGPNHDLHLSVHASSPAYNTVSIRDIANFINGTSLNIARLEIGEGLLNRGADLTAINMPSSPRAKVKDLTVPFLAMDSGTRLNISDMYPRLQKFTLIDKYNHDAMFRHTTLTSLRLDSPRSYETLSKSSIPALEELVIGPDGGLEYTRPSTTAIFAALKRLTVKQSPSYLLSFPPIVCPSLEFLNIAGYPYVDTPEQMETFNNTVEAFLQQSQAERIALRVDSWGELFRRLLLQTPNLHIHRLEMPDVSWILLAKKLKENREFPHNMKEIIVWRKPSTGYLVNDVRSLQSQSPPSQDLEQPADDRQSPNGRVVTVFLPEGQREAEVLEENNELSRSENSMKLFFRSVSQDMVYHLLVETGGEISYEDRVLYKFQEL